MPPKIFVGVRVADGLCPETQMVPPIECDLGYRFPTRTLNPNSNLNPNPKTDPNRNPDPKSNKNLCSAKRHPNKFKVVL